MKFSRNLISTFIDISHIDNDTLCKTLNDIGLEVESISKIHIPRNVVVGKILSIIKHQNANKLNICEVDVGSEVLQIVCGASNVTKGAFVPVALVGAKLNKITIKKALLRDVESCGMICSSTEINLPKLEDGILILDSSIGELVLGKELCQYEFFNDVIFDVGVTSNRGDCFSVQGIARDLAVVFDIKLKTNTESSDVDVAPGIGRILNISFEHNLHSSLYYKIVELKALNDSLSLRLYLALCDELSDDLLQNIMRFTTYMSGVLIRGYKFDASKYLNTDKKITLHIKKDKNNIEGVYFEEKLLSRVGIFGNEKYSANGNSKMVVFEASFVPAHYVSEAIFANDIAADEHTTFLSKRGSSPLLEDGMMFLCNLLKSLSSSIFYSSSQQVIQNYPSVRIDFTFNDIAKIIGSEIPSERITGILKKMNFTINAAVDNSFISLNPPLYRQDIKTIQDVAEEILRIVGINSIVSMPQIIKQHSNIDKNYALHRFRRKLAQKAIANGFFECVHYVFCKKETLESYGYPTLPKHLDITNPITSELNTLRSSLMPSMLETLERNQNYDYTSIKLFEIGSVYDSKRQESCNIAFAVSGNKTNPRYPYPKGQEWNFYDVASSIERVIGDFELLQTSANALYHPNICAKIIKNNVEIGILGKLNPRFATNFNGDCFICELSFDLLYSITESPQYSEFSKYQASKRDITILIDKNVSFRDIKKSVLEARFQNLTQIIPLDIYESDEFEDKISLSFRVVFQAMDCALTLEDLKIDNIIELLNATYGATLR